MTKHASENNRISRSRRPRDLKAHTAKYLHAMLSGETLNRRTVHLSGAGEYNESSHAYISDMRNRQLIPVNGVRNKKYRTNDYWIDEYERKRYSDPTLRPQQQEEMREHVNAKRRAVEIKRFRNLLSKLSKDDALRFLQEVAPDFFSSKL